MSSTPHLDATSLIWRRLIFYVGIPVALGVSFGLARAGMLAPALPRPVSLIYWVALLMVLWLLMDAATRLVSAATVRWRMPLWALLILGGMLETIVGTPYIGLHQRFFASFLPPDTLFAPYFEGEFRDALTSMPRWLLQNAGAITLWAAANYFFDRFVGLPRFARAQPGREQPGPAVVAPTPSDSSLSRLMEKLPATARGDVIALSAEDHYVRVVTTRGSALVYGKVTALASSMPPDWGVRVHRSHWVSRSAARRLHQRDGKYRLTIEGGTEIPVSERYVEVLRTMGL